MANILDSILNLTTQLQKLGVSTNSVVIVLDKLEKQSLNTSSNVFKLDGSLQTLREKIKYLQNQRDILPADAFGKIGNYNNQIKKLEGQITRLEGAGTSKLKTWFKGAFDQSQFADLFKNPLLFAGKIAGNAIKTGAEDEMLKANFEVKLGGKKAANELLEDITSYAEKTPFDKLGLGDAAETMLNFGVAQKDIMPNLKMLGDLAVGDAGKLSSLTQVFSKMSASGKMSGDDLNSLIEAGFNPLEIMSQQTGQGVDVLKQKLQDGTLPFETLRTAMMSATSEGGNFHGAAERMNETVGGKWATALEKVNAILGNLYNILAPVLLPVLDAVIYVIDIISGVLGWLFESISNGNPWIIGLAVAIGAMAIAMNFAAISTKLQDFWLNILILKERAMMLWTNLGSVAIYAKAAAMGVVTAATWLWNAALNANPIGAIILVVAALSAAVYGLSQAFSGASAQEAMDSEVKQRVIDKTMDQRIELEMLFETLRRAKKGSKEYNDTLARLEEMQPGIVEQYNLQAGAVKDINKAQKDMIGNIEKVALAEAKKELLKEKIKERLTRQEKFKNGDMSIFELASEGWTATTTGKTKGQRLREEEKHLAKDLAKDEAAAQKAKQKMGKDKNEVIDGIADPKTETGGGSGKETKMDHKTGGSGGAGKKTNEAIATGGTKSVVNNFSFKSMIENLSIHKAGFTESIEAMQAQLEDALLRTLAMADSTAG